MGDVERVTEEAIGKGGILFVMFFDSHAQNEEEVKNRLTELAAKIAQEQGVIYSLGTIEPPMRDEMDGKEVYSTSGEVKVLAKDLKSAMHLANAYGPVYLEVLMPEKRIVGFEELQEVMNDVAQRSYSLSQFIVKNSLGPEALKSFMRNIKYREELGKRLREKGVENEKKDA